MIVTITLLRPPSRQRQQVDRRGRTEQSQQREQRGERYKVSVITRPVGVVSRRPFEQKTVLGLAEQGQKGRKRGVKGAILAPSRTFSKRLALPRQNRMAVAPSRSEDSTRHTSRLSATRRRYLHRRSALLSFSSSTLPEPAMECDRLIARRTPIEKHRALL